MFGSDKRQGFLTGTPGGAVTRTPKPKAQPTASGPVTSLPNPVVGPVRPAPRAAPVEAVKSAATQVPSKPRSIPGAGQASMSGSKSNYGTVRHGQGVMRAQSPGKGLWSAITSQMAPGRWFSN